MSLLGIAYFIRTIDFREVWSHLHQADLRLFLIGLGLYLLIQAICAYRWRLMARVIGYSGPFHEFLLYYYIGMFLNLFLPTAIGGDLGRWYYFSRGEAGPTRAIVSVLADRGIGLLALILIASVVLLTPFEIVLPTWVPAAIFTLSLVALCAFLLPFHPKVRSRLSRIGEKVALPLTYWETPKTLVATLFLSLLLQLSVVVVNMCVGVSLGVSLSWISYLALVPLVSTVSMVPSIGGLGVRENAYVFFLSAAGISKELGGAFASEYLALLVLASLVGGIIWVVTPLPIRTESRSPSC